MNQKPVAATFTTMKKIITLLLIGCFAASCQLQNVDSTYYPFSHDLTIKLRTITNASIVDMGSAGHNEVHISGSGTAFRQVQFHVKNTSSTDQIIDFNQIFLLDSKNNKYHVSLCTPAMRLVTKAKLDHKVRAGKSVTFMANFAPGFPKDELVQRILIKDKVFQL